MEKPQQKNVLGLPLESCSEDPMTGWFRDGCCNTDARDQGLHLLCAAMTDEFLAFSKSAGNDLSTPRPEFGFPGLVAGNQWCLCARRWKDAYDEGCAPKLFLRATHEKMLELVPLSVLSEFSADVNH